MPLIQNFFLTTGFYLHTHIYQKNIIQQNNNNSHTFSKKTSKGTITCVFSWIEVKALITIKISS